MSKHNTVWTCSCGKRVKLTAAQIESGKALCPHCGAPVGRTEKDSPPLSPSDTQMINVSDMARMAQEGVDLAVSGEWDTSESFLREPETKPKKKTR